MSGPELTAQVLVNIDVDDIEKAIQFYTKAFGLTVGRRFDSEFIELLGFPLPIYLLEAKEKSPAYPTHAGRSYQRHWTPFHFDIVVQDLATALEKTLRLGARQESEIRIEKYGKLVVLSDPFGHGFCLIEFNPSGYDAL